MVLECDVKGKEGRSKCLRENTVEDRLVDGNAGMKRGRESLE